MLNKTNNSCFNFSKNLNESLLDKSSIDSNNLSTSQLDQIYNGFYFLENLDLNKTTQINDKSQLNITNFGTKKSDGKIALEDVMLLILWLYNQSLDCNLPAKRLKIFTKGLCMDENDRVLEDGFNAICNFYNFQKESVLCNNQQESVINNSQEECKENSNDYKFKICEKTTKSENFKKFLCCIGQSQKIQHKKSFARLVDYVHKRMEINKKIFKSLKESNNLDDFSELCKAINPEAIILESRIRGVWELFLDYKDKVYKPMFDLQNNENFQALSSRLSGEVKMIEFIKTKKGTSNYIGVSNI